MQRHADRMLGKLMDPNAQKTLLLAQEGQIKKAIHNIQEGKALSAYSLDELKQQYAEVFGVSFE